MINTPGLSPHMVASMLYQSQIMTAKYLELEFEVHYVTHHFNILCST